MPGPLSLLCVCIFPIVGGFGIHSLPVGLASIAVLLLSVGWLVPDWRATLQRALLGAIAAASITITTYLYGGHHLATAAAAGCRILYIVLPTALVGSLIRPSELGDHLAQRLRLPARPIAAGVVALQRIESLGDQWQQIQRARRVRGLGMDGGLIRRVRGAAAAAFALLLTSLREASESAVAMDARGFAAASDRTWAGAAPWRAADTLMVAIAVGLAALPWILAGLVFAA